MGRVQVMNVHLLPPVDERGRTGIGPYLSTRKPRLRETRELHGHLEPGLPTLVLGDCNEHDRGYALDWLAGQGFRDALREFDRKTSTWRWRYGPITLRRRLDHILYSPQLHCLSARVIRAGGSDHYPVVARFQAAREAAPTQETERTQ
jgi:endonuclease/exonuclease/phosphatase (EEP) superfamily protein YafD